MAIEIPESATWYVKTGLDRALRMTKQQIEQTDKQITKLYNRLAKLIETDPQSKDLEFIRAFIDEAKNIRNYYEEWLREATQAYEALPKEIRPFDLGDAGRNR